MNRVKGTGQGLEFVLVTFKKEEEEVFGDDVQFSSRSGTRKNYFLGMRKSSMRGEITLQNPVHHNKSL